jgi:hypothetical protein
MSSFLSEIEGDLDEIFHDTGKTVVWNGGIVPALVDEVETETELVTGGFSQGVETTVKLRRRDVGPDKPKVGQRVQFGDDSFRIIQVIDRPPHPLITLKLESPEK